MFDDVKHEHNMRFLRSPQSFIQHLLSFTLLLLSEAIII